MADAVRRHPNILFISVLAAGLALLWYFFIASPKLARAAVTLVNQTMSGMSTNASPVSAPAINVFKGNLLAVACRCGDQGNCSASTITVSDTAGNTFTRITSAVVDATDRTDMFYAKNVSGNSADVVTCSYTGLTAPLFNGTAVIQYAGLDPNNPLATSANGVQTVNSLNVNSNSFSTSSSRELIVAFATQNAAGITFTPGSGFTLEQTSPDQVLASEDMTATSIGQSMTASMSSDHNNLWALVAAAFVPVPQGIEVSARSDTLSDSRVSATSNHTIAFTTNNAVMGSSTITLTFPVSLPSSMDCGDLDAATSSQFNFNWPSCQATATAWGFGVIGNIATLQAPIDSTANIHVATGTPITIKIGTNATFQQPGVRWITNPATAGTYTVSIGGTFGGYGNMLIAIVGGNSNPHLPQVVQQAESPNLNAITTLSQAFTSNVTQGDLLAIMVFWKTSPSPNVSSVIDTLGNVFVSTPVSNRPTDGSLQIWYAKNVTGGADTVTVNWSGSAGDVIVWLAEISGLNTSSPLDATAIGSGSSGTTITSGSFTTSFSNDFVLAFGASDAANGLPGTGFTAMTLNPGEGSGDEYEILSSPGAYTASMNFSGAITRGALTVAAFRPAQSLSGGGVNAQAQVAESLALTVSSVSSGSNTSPVVVASGVADVNGGGQSMQSHIIYAANSAQWWIFYVNENSNTTLRTAYSNDLVTWTAGGTKSLAHALTSNTDLAIAYKNIASTDVIHIQISYSIASASRLSHIRATITPNTVTFGSESQVGATSGISPADPDETAVAYDANNKVWVEGGWEPTCGGDPCTASSVNADLGSSWTSGFSKFVDLDTGAAGTSQSAGLFDLGSGKMLNITDDTANNNDTFTQLHYSVFNGTSWSPTNPQGNVLASAIGTAQSDQDWAAVKLSNTDIRVVARSGSNTYLWRKFDGSSWSTPSASIPNQTSKAGTDLFLSTDGTSIWLFVIDTDSANTARYLKFDGNNWGSWTALDTTTQVRDSISGYATVANGRIAIDYVQQNGATWDLVVESLAVSPGCTADDGAAVTQINSTATTVPFGTINPNTFYQGCQDLTVSTNAGGGYSLSAQENSAMKTANGKFTIPDTTCDGGGCTTVTAATWMTSTNNGFGHTCTNQSGSDCSATFGSGTKFKPVPNIAAGTGLGTPQYAQGNAGSCTNCSSETVAFGSNVATGDLIVAAFNYGDTSSLQSVTDTVGNVYTRAGNEVHRNTGGTNEFVDIFYAKNAKGGADSVTVTLAASISDGPEVYVQEYSGLDTVSPLDVTASSIGSGTNEDSGSATTQYSNELIFGYGDDGGVISPGSGFTARSTLNGNIVEDMVGTAAGSYHATATQNNSPWAMLMATFKPASVNPMATLMSNIGPVSSSTGRVKYRLSVPSSQAAGVYSTLVTYTILGTF